MPDLMASVGNNIANFNNKMLYVGTYLRSRGEDSGNLFPQIFATYSDCSSDNVPFTCYIHILEN